MNIIGENMEKYVPKVIYNRYFYYIGFVDKKIDDPRIAHHFMGEHYQLRSVELLNDTDKSCKITPTLYFQISNGFIKSKQKYNLKKFKYELNK